MHFGAMQNAQIFRQVTYFCDVGSQGELTFETSLLHFFFFNLNLKLTHLTMRMGAASREERRAKNIEHHGILNSHSIQLDISTVE